MWDTLFVFIFFTLLFFLIIDLNKNTSRCNENDKNCYDGNGCYQYKGRGEKNERVEILLSRIDWLAKNSSNKSLYTTSYIISYAIMLAVSVILYAYSNYIVSPWELILFLFSSFIITFSILNLFSFHTDRYNDYYIRENIRYISNQLQIPIFEPPLPSSHSSIPHRTQVQDVLSN
jgi:hypothetical protein